MIAATTVPGRQAARELGVRSPLDEVALTKAEIRALSHRAGLPTWDEPASACLSSRIPYDTEVTPEKLRAIEQAEAALRDLGFRVCRVRHHDEVARIELGRAEMARALEPSGLRVDRARRQSRRVPLRRARSSRLPVGQPQRAHPAPGHRLVTAEGSGPEAPGTSPAGGHAANSRPDTSQSPTRAKP